MTTWSDESLPGLAIPSLQEDTCRGPSCRMAIVWAVTEKGKRIPLDRDPKQMVVMVPNMKQDRNPAEDPPRVASVQAVYMPHHATCPDAGRFRT